MDEVWSRLAVVAGVLALAVGVVLRQRRRSAGPVRLLGATGLAPGMYLFTSRDCPTCAAARTRLEAKVGADSFQEISWEDRPELFSGLGVTAVPAVLRVDEDGEGRLYPGQPREVLSGR